MRLYHVAAIAVAVGSVVTGCSSGGDSDKSPTPSAFTPIANPLAEPTIMGSTVVFTAKRYQFELPVGWTPDWNFVRTSDVPLDIIFAPDTVEGVQASVLLECDRPAPVSLADFVSTRINTTRRLDNAEPRESASLSLSGVPATVLDWETSRNNIAVARREIVAVTSDCGWILSLTMPPGSRTQYEDLFAALLASFKFL